MRETSTAVVYVCPTGVRPNDQILELAVIQLDPQGRQEGVWQTMLRPARHALDIHPRGITYQDVKNAPSFEQIAHELAELLDGRLVVSSSLYVGLPILVESFRRIGQTLPDSASWTIKMDELESQMKDRLPTAVLPMPNFQRSTAESTAPSDIFPAVEAAVQMMYRYQDILRGPDLILPDLEPLHFDMSKFTAEQRPVLRYRDIASLGWPWIYRLFAGLPATGNSDIDSLADLVADLVLARLIPAIDTDNEESAAHGSAKAVGVEPSRTVMEQLLAAGRDHDFDTEDIESLTRTLFRALVVRAFVLGGVNFDRRDQLEQVGSLLELPERFVQEQLNLDESLVRSYFEGMKMGAYIAFTGALALPREMWTNRAEAMSMRVGPLTEETSVLIAADFGASSVKKQQAKELGVPVIGEREFAWLLNAIELRVSSGQPLHAPDAAVPASTEIEPQWPLQPVFPWVGEYIEAFNEVGDVVSEWLDDHEHVPLCEMSPYLEPERLPRTVNRRLKSVERWKQQFPQPLTASVADLRRIRGVGINRLNELVSAVAFEALDLYEAKTAGSRPQHTSHVAASTLPGSVTAGVQELRGAVTLKSAEIIADATADLGPTSSLQVDADFIEVMRWAMLTGAEMPVDPPKSVADAVNRIRSIPGLQDPIVEVINDAYRDVQSIMRIDERFPTILQLRMLEQQTLDSVGKTLDITPERVRQLENLAREEFEKGESALLIEVLARRFLPFRSEDEVLEKVPALAKPGPIPGFNMLETVSALTKRWKLDKGWLLAPRIDNRIEKVLASMANDCGVVDLNLAARVLDAGLDNLKERLRTFRRNQAQVVGDHVIIQASSHADRAVAVLSITGEPLTIEEIALRLGGGNVRSIMNQMSSDSRLMRTGREKWALRSWGLQEYTTIADWIGRHIDVTGSYPLAKLLAAADSIGVSEGSIRAFASGQDFELVDGMVRRRIEVTT